MTTHRTGVLLVQIGTPTEPTAAAVRPYLNHFLSDRRVIDIHPLLWQPLLKGIISPLRAPRSAKNYQKIWRRDGSPLLAYSRRQAIALQKQLGSRYFVQLGTAYAQPNLDQSVKAFTEAKIERVIVIPLFPQYSSTTTASVYDAVHAAFSGRHQRRFVPALQFQPPYFNHSAYIEAEGHLVESYLKRTKYRPDHVIFSYHGIPTRYVATGDIYPQHCEATTRLLAKRLSLRKGSYSLTYQSRFGSEKWLGPATVPTLKTIAARNESVLIVTPGFTTDCLETLHELGMEARSEFIAAGGKAKNYQLTGCLNDDPKWIGALAQLARQVTS